MVHPYTNRLVAFIDILGISDQLIADATGVFATDMSKLLSTLIRRDGNCFLVLNHIKTGREIEIEFDKPHFNGSKITTVSDAITMSFPDCVPETEFYSCNRIVPVLSCLEAVFFLQRALLCLGIRSRGGISYGRLLHKRDLVLGEGLVRAYRIESAIAKYPRTIIDGAIIEVLLNEPLPNIVLLKERIAHLVRIDTDGHYFVDYLGFSPLDGARTVRSEITNILDDTKDGLASAANSSIQEKLRWLYDYSSTTLEFMNYPDRRLRVNDGTRFGDRFVRSYESATEWLDKNKGILPGP